MRNPSYWKRSLAAAGICLAALLAMPVLAWAQLGAGALTNTNTYEGREEGEEIPLDLEKGSFGKSLPFDVIFKVSGAMPPGFGQGSQVDARFVEFKRPPDCASFFNQYTLSRQPLSNLNDTDSIPVRRRRRAVAIEQSGFRQATVFDASGVNIQARLLQNMVRLGEASPDAAAAVDAAAAAAPKGARFLVDFPALRPNHYYCFQFVSRRALSKEDLEVLHLKFQEAVDKELRETKYQERREDYTTFKVGVEDYENLRITLSAVIEEELAEGSNQVVLAPPNSFFNAGARLEDITGRYREQFEQIAVKTVGARLLAIDAFDEQIGLAMLTLGQLADKKFNVQVPDGAGGKTEVTMDGRNALLRSQNPQVVALLEQLKEAGIDLTELVGTTAESRERLKARLGGLDADEPLARALPEIWDSAELEARIDSIQTLSQAVQKLTKIASAASVKSDPLNIPQPDASDQDKADLVEYKKQLEISKRLDDEDDVEFYQKKVDALQALVDGKAESKIPKVNLFFLAAQYLDGAATQLRELQKLLRSREEDIAGWVRQVLVEEQASLIVGGTTVADYDTRAIWYMSADIGSGISDLEDFFTYVGWNIYLRPVNKKAHLSWGARPFGIGEEIMRRFSFTIGVVQSGFDTRDGQYEGVIGNNAAVLGAGFRINDSLRFSVGGMLFESQNPDPLVENSRLEWSPYAAISLDWNIGASFSGLLPKNK